LVSQLFNGDVRGLANGSGTTHGYINQGVANQFRMLIGHGILGEQTEKIEWRLMSLSGPGAISISVVIHNSICEVD
jgi:hypothetical protein